MTCGHCHPGARGPCQYGDAVVRAKLILVDLVSGLLAALLLVVWASPLRGWGDPFSLSWGMAAWLAVAFIGGMAVGRAQARLADRALRSGPLSAIAVGLIARLPVFVLTHAFIQFTRIMPVPGGGDSLDPSLGELASGLAFWSAFVLGAMAGVGQAKGRPSHPAVAADRT